MEIKVLKHLSLLCQKALGKYPTTFEEDQNLFKTKKNISFNLRNCLLLLMSEKTVLSYFIYFCEYCLELLKLKTQIDVLNKFRFIINIMMVNLIFIYKKLCLN